MRRMVDIDLMDDTAIQANMAFGSLLILLAGAVVGVLGAIMLPTEEVGFAWFALLVVVSAIALPVHELVHAAAFKVLSGGLARISFGYGNGMLYTSAAGTILSSGKFCAVLLAPAVMVTAALGIGSLALGFPLLGWFLAVIHLAGCTGDIAYVRLIASEPKATHVLDTPHGISLFHDE